MQMWVQAAANPGRGGVTLCCVKRVPAGCGGVVAVVGGWISKFITDLGNCQEKKKGSFLGGLRFLI